MVRDCQNCKNSFTIEDEDSAFYEKIKVPPPSWCPECRLQRRMIWRNERNLTKRNCDLCKRDVLSMYGNNVPFPVYCPECWRSDNWDALSYGQDYDSSQPFFNQFQELMAQVPRPALGHNGTNVNCEYANMIQDVKNVYFSFSVIYDSEDVYYSTNVDRSKEVFDSFQVSDSEIIYGSINSVRNYNCQYCYWSSGCVDCFFTLDCVGCSHCFGCVGLRNRQYNIFNEQYSKEDYEKKIKSLDLGSYRKFKELEKLFEEHILEFPRKYARITNSVRSTGDEILNSKNVQHSFNITGGAENCKYLLRCLGPKETMDGTHLGDAEIVYEHAFGGSSSGQNLKFIIFGGPASQHISYSDFCTSSSYLFGCIGLRSKEYCILNKQYLKEEYEMLVPKIIEHMRTTPYVDGRGLIYKYGEFFPPEFSPFAYNESVIQEYLPLTKEKATELGYRWKERESRHYQITKLPSDLPDHIKEVPESITSDIIGCSNEGKPDWCISAFRIIPEELGFYRRMNIPLPRYCQNCRHFNQLAKRNPIKLWHRTCQCVGQKSENGVYANTVSHFHGSNHCPNEFETSYAPERPEIVYCEQCYNAEVV